MDFKQTFITEQDAQELDLDSYYSNWDVANAIKHPDTTTAVLEILAEKSSSYFVRTAIAENPNVTHHVLSLLSSKTSHRWEWRAIYQAFIKKVTNAAETHNEKMPYAAFIVNGKISDPTYVAGYFSIAGSAIAEDLWHDLATREIISLGYEEDTIDGDHFGPLYEEKTETSFESRTPSEYLLSPGYFCTWIERTHTYDEGYFFDYLTEVLVDEPESIIEEFTENPYDSDYAQLVAAAHGVIHNHIEIKDKKAFDSFVIYTMEERDSEMLDNDVTIISAPEHLEGPRFADLKPEQIQALVDNLLTASMNYFHRNFKTTAHLLSLILLHPHTPEEVKQKIIEAEIPGTRSAVEAVTTDK